MTPAVNIPRMAPPSMTGALFQVSPLNTFILCVGMRVLMGLCCGLIFKGLQKLDKSRTWSYILSAMTAHHQRY